MVASLRSRLVTEIDPPPEWRGAFERTPRHLFVPQILGCAPADDKTGLTDGFELSPASDRAHWLDLVYSDRALVVVQVGERYSSSSRPSVMLRFLKLLDPVPGDTVLEIGTGTGYNAAIMSERLGDRNVTTIDIDSELIEAALVALSECGHSPTVAVGDGLCGWPERAPYDRIIATCAVHRIPPAWQAQLKPEGVVVVPLTNNMLVRLVRLPDGTLEGRGHLRGAAFMRLRTPGSSQRQDTAMPARGEERTTIERPPGRMASAYLRFYAGLTRPGLEFRGGDEIDWYLSADDGSWATVMEAAGKFAAAQAGPRRLWTEYEAAEREWSELGRPRWDRYGLTARPDGHQFIWLDSPDSKHRWELT